MRADVLKVRRCRAVRAIAERSRRKVLTMRNTTLTYAALAGSLAAMTAGSTAFASTPRAATTITVKATHTAVAAGTNDTFTSVLKTGSKVLPGAIVKLREEKAGTHSFVDVSQSTTNSKGVATFTVKVAKGNDHFQAVYLGSSKRLPSHSGVIAVQGK